jgi:hypothetical protein
MADVSLSTFPRNASEAMALFYVQNVVFPTLEKADQTPENLMVEYMKALERFKKAYSDFKAPARIG